jgi:Domain of unknown function (DUF4129)
VDDGVTGRTVRAPGDRHAPRIDYLRLILAALLLVIVIAGVRAEPGLTWMSSWHGPWHDRGHGFALVAGLELFCVGLLVALRVRRRRAPDGGPVAAKLRLALPRIIIVVMIGLAAPLVQVLHLPKTKPRPVAPHPVRIGKPRPIPKVQVAPTSSGSPEILKYVLLAVIAVALVAAFILLLRRVRSREMEAAVAPEEDDQSALREAVAAGRTALGELSEPRMAIIHCYLAMERSLAEAGAARVAAETPDELLARSIAAGLLRGAAAAELTSLFYEARFSTHQVPPSARERALRALDAISAELDASRSRSSAAHASESHASEAQSPEAQSLEAQS